jgi:DNA-directed RNA polymerase I, II, and III subunit RPABC2
MSYFDDNNDNEQYLYESDNDEKKETNEELDEEADVNEVDDEEEEPVEEEQEEIINNVDEDEEDEDEDDKPVKELPMESYINKNYDDDEDDDDDNEDSESYLKKFDKELNENYLVNFHPECVHHNYDEILALCNVIRNNDNIIIDDLHKTIPYLTKYERARILGQRAKQINIGATPFVKVPENVIDGYLIAELELKQKRIPFIIRRPLPNGGSEYWKVNDLEDIIY